MDVIELACSVRTGKILVEYFLFFAILWTSPGKIKVSLLWLYFEFPDNKESVSI